MKTNKQKAKISYIDFSAALKLAQATWEAHLNKITKELEERIATVDNHVSQFINVQSCKGETIKDYAEASRLLPFLAPSFEVITVYGFKFESLFLATDRRIFIEFTHSQLMGCYDTPLSLYLTLCGIDHRFRICAGKIKDSQDPYTDMIDFETCYHLDPNKIALDVYCELSSTLDP